MPPSANAQQAWDPALYRRFEAERTRPARDLLGRVPLDRASAVFDLGCGPGNSTELLVDRFGIDAVTGLDTSEAMLLDAAARLPGCRFERGDVSHFTPNERPDLLFANAVLQWVPDHAALVPHLFDLLAPGGVLAIQMPDNLAESSHRLMRDVARTGPFAATIGEAGELRRRIVLDLDVYYDLLAQRAASVEVWRTVYHHPMASPDAIVDWLRATGLKPFLDPLAPGPRAAFLDAYRQRIDAAYRPHADGKRLLAFPRIFIVAQRSA
jgi:trans-aconitate 2-methyltransferase